MMVNPEYEKWEREFRASRLGSKALKYLQQNMREICPELYHCLEKVVLEACYNSYRFKEESDSLSRARVHKRKQYQDSETIIRHIESLKKHLESDLDLSLDILRHGLFSKGYEYDTAQKHLKRLIFYLDIYREGMEFLKQTQEPSSSFYNECQEGNMLDWKRSIGIEKEKLGVGKKFNAPLPETFLIFELAIYFKCWTTNGGQRLFKSNGEVMIDRTVKGTPLSVAEGKPSIPILTNFVNGTFNLNLEVSMVRERYNKLSKDAHLMEWHFDQLPTLDDL